MPIMMPRSTASRNPATPSNPVTAAAGASVGQVCTIASAISLGEEIMVEGTCARRTQASQAASRVSTAMRVGI